MTRVDEFDSFFRTGFDSVLHVTYALCGDRHVALEATTDAFRRAWRDWAKIRDRSPLSYVRTEAWKATTLNRTTHPLRRRHEEDSDVELLDALGGLTVDQRRLLILMTLGNSDLEVASREVGLRAEDGIEQATDALARLEQVTGESIAELEVRLHALSQHTAQLQAPSPTSVRTAARRGAQRNAALLVAAAFVSVIGAGLVAADGDAFARQQALPQREQLGSERADIVLDARKLSGDDLLSANQVAQFDPDSSWTVDGTDEDTSSTAPYATCPTKRFADPDPLRVFVRTFSADEGSARVVQSVEVSRNAAKAEKGAREIMGWFANCAHPRVQLLSTHTVERSFGDFTILRLRANRSPERTFTVGFADSGSITSTVVHEVDGTEPPSVEAFAELLNASVSQVCQLSGGRCSRDDLTVVAADPPITAEAPGFLGVVDLPPITDVNRVWAAVAAESDPNPAASPCEQATFTGDSVVEAESRIFVLYQASEIPDRFGITETVGRFSDADAAEKFVSRMSGRIDDCPDENLTAELDQTASIDEGSTQGEVWRIGLEAGGQTVHYRVGFVRRGDVVAQVTLVTAPGYDVKKDVFTDLVTRAGVRLQYVE